MKRTALGRRGTRLRRQSPRTAERRAGDRLWMAHVKGESGGRCELCGGVGHGGPMDGHHVWGKQAHPALRHVTENGVCLCRVPCHRYAEDHPVEFRAWFAERFPERWAIVEAARRGAETHAAPGGQP